MIRFILSFVVCLAVTSVSSAEIVVDYQYDTNSFFNPGTTDGQAARAAMDAAVGRYNRVIDFNLQAASINDTNDGRIGFTHPGTGNSIEVSGATSGSDSLIGAGAGAADVYTGGLNFATNDWTLYAGGRSLGGPAGVGGTGGGTNFTSVFSDPNSHLNRGFNVGSGTLPVWGGAISFETSLNWHFDTGSAPSTGESDFYSIALHEVGHALGLSANYSDFTDHQSGATFTGANALAAANADNNTTAITSLALVSGTNRHWADNGSPLDPGYPVNVQSFIYAPGQPNSFGTVAPGALQDLLLEPTANTVNGLPRFELTNVDVGQLRDLGWAVFPVPEPGSLALLLVGAMACGMRRSRRQNG